MDRMACVEVRGAGAREDNRDALAGRLGQFSPDVEPSRDAPGVFWVNASGLSHLYRSPRHWAERIAAALRADGYRETTVAVGFTRFGTYAVARRLASTERRVAVIRDPAGERALAGKAPLDRLGLDRALIGSLEKLGVRTVSAFLELPAEGVRPRFGPDAHSLHRRASGDLKTAPGEDYETDHHAGRADQSQLFTDDTEHEVGMRLRQEEIFLKALSQTHPGPSSAAQRQQ